MTCYLHYPIHTKACNPNQYGHRVFCHEASQLRRPPSRCTKTKPRLHRLPHKKKNESFNEAEPSSSLSQDAIWTPFITRKRPVPRGNTEPFRTIGWVTAPAPFPTSERGNDSQRDRLNQPRGFEPGTSSFRGGRFAHGATWTP